MQLTQADFMFVYDFKLFKFLRFEKDIPYLFCALNEHTNNKFFLFQRSDELKAALEQFNSDRV